MGVYGMFLFSLLCGNTSTHACHCMPQCWCSSQRTFQPLLFSHCGFWGLNSGHQVCIVRWSPALTWRGSSDCSTIIAPTPDPCKHHLLGPSCVSSWDLLNKTRELGTPQRNRVTEKFLSSSSILFYFICVSSACVYVCAPHVCPKLAGIRRGSQIP